MLVSLVAHLDDDIVGHILMTRMKIVSEDRDIDAVSLAPMAVSSTLQGQGIGSELVEQSLARCRELGEQIVIVLGRAARATSCRRRSSRAQWSPT